MTARKMLLAMAIPVGVVAFGFQTARPVAQQKPAAPAPAPGGGMFGSAEARAKQEALEKATPRLKVTEEVLRLSVPGQTIGETVGVAKNSKGHLFVFSRTGRTATVKGSAASMLFEFDQDLKFVKEWGPNNYASGFAHTVRVDKDDNVWMVDEGSNMIVKFRPDASVAMVLGRKEEPLDWLEKFVEEGDHLEGTPTARPGVFNRPTDVTWDTNGNIFVSDGYNNSRVAKFTKDGNWANALGDRGSAPNQFNTPHAITSDARGNIYVADRGNRRVQVFDPELQPVRIIEGMGAPWSVCVSPGATQYLFSGDGNGKIYKFGLDGKLVGWAQTSQGLGQSGCLVHELHCESETVLYKGDCSTWQVEKLTIAQ
ncbi:MAG: 6-bladed beta-propeller [Acidobacteriota bacterium]|nr:6-bladed beta-propeller [Acidobacteriota bacterium]